ncbi:uncharacterized protein VP01_1655g5 [Puccinia sorghi]|uniref:Uncharacterized protein n=1 Tax=Puccinia sorghi TaxID=27349 RepID=A0A0L6VIB8_9BASI|nr:uncharacterized protein VP01_1655g5 [Puccinia sorghi]
MYHPPSTSIQQNGFGTFLQQWARVDVDKLSDSQRDLYRQVLGLHP